MKSLNMPLKKLVQDPRNHLNFSISGVVQVECTEALYYDNPEKQNSVEIGDRAAYVDSGGVPGATS